MSTPQKVAGGTAALFAVLILGVWALPADHDRGDLTGTWRVQVQLAETGRSTIRFVLRQDDDLVTGHYDGSYGTHPLTGTVTGGTVELTFTIQDGTPVTFRGQVVGGHIEGTCDYGDVAGKGTWNAKRATSVWSF
ncbi:MAG: hypothetical protein O3A25_15935 [Acidobacteria bacterium]|nr:hypothetical protein [Acidobacteriota bacterium]